MTQPDSMISIKGLSKDFKDLKALDNISLDVGRGELFAFLGPNGAGKTTTIRILTGLTKLTSGQAWLGGHDVEREKVAAKRQCGVVPQHINLDAELTVEENLRIHGKLFGMERGRIQARIDELLEYVALADRKDTVTKKLSGGQKRRVQITRALVHEPAIIFLDEPSVGLDAAIRRKIWALIKQIQQDGATVFLTTHYIEEAEFLADRVAFIDNGKLVALGTPQEMMDRLGSFALDIVTGGEMETKYFQSRQDAEDYVQGSQGSVTLRRVNLEDAFLAIMGKKI